MTYSNPNEIDCSISEQMFLGQYLPQSLYHERGKRRIEKGLDDVYNKDL